MGRGGAMYTVTLLLGAAPLRKVPMFRRYAPVSFRSIPLENENINSY